MLVGARLHSEGEPDASGEATAVVLYHLVRIEGEWRITARLTNRQGPAGGGEVEPNGGAAGSESEEVRGVVERYARAMGARDAKEAAREWAAVSWCLRAAPIAHHDPNAGLTWHAETGTPVQLLSVGIEQAAPSNDVRLSAALAGDLAWCELRDNEGGEGSRRAYQLIRMSGGWKIAAEIVWPGESADDSFTPDDSLVNIPSSGPAISLDWNTGQRNGTPAQPKPVGLSDGLAPWRDLATALGGANGTGNSAQVPVGNRRRAATRTRARQTATSARERHLLRLLALAGFGVAMLVFIITRFWRLGEYPIYFFTDEAYLPIVAEDLITRGFRDAKGVLFPVYFPVSVFTTPLLSVYFHAFTVHFFGKTVEIARGTNTVFAVLGSVAVGLTLRQFFRIRLWWVAPLVLAAMPGWFNYSRTAFETVTMTGLYALFLGLYLLYRLKSPWFLYPAIVTLGAVFYTYSNGQAVAGVTGLLLAIVDMRYHLRNWRFLIAAVLLAGAVAFPYVRYRQSDPVGATAQLRNNLRSYWFEPLPLPVKLQRYSQEYLYGLSPQYWFFPNSRDLDRHRLKGYPQIRTEFLPFAILGALLCLRRIKHPAYRLALIAALASPAGAAVAEVNVSRALAFVIPASMFIVIGLDGVASVLHPARLRLAGGVALCAVLSFASLNMLRDALTNGPRWFPNYGLYGQQWGAKQLFDIIPVYLKANSQNQVFLTPTWANGSDLFPRFFFKQGDPSASRLRMQSVNDFIGQIQPISDKVILVMTPEELEGARASGRFSTIAIDRVLNWPDGRPGFYFTRLGYSADAEAQLAAEREMRRRPVDTQVLIDGVQVPLRLSAFDGGSPAEMVDGNPDSLDPVSGGQSGHH